MLSRSTLAKKLAWNGAGGLFILIALGAAATTAILGAWWIGTHVSLFWATLFVLIGWPLIATVGYWVMFLAFVPVSILLHILVGRPPQD